MGAVHGVYLKYVGLSVLSYAGYALLVASDDECAAAASAAAAMNVDGVARGLISTSTSATTTIAALPLWRVISATLMGYSCIVNGAIAMLFRLKRGMFIIGKDAITGSIPLWSYVLFFPFHGPSILYTYIHTRLGTTVVTMPNTGEQRRQVVPVATQVQPGWWVGGCYAYELNKTWAAIIDHTVECPEWCIASTKEYLLLPTWDGVPATPEQLEVASNFAVAAAARHKGGDVLVHCAHGRGRSTTVMCACLVKAGLFDTWQEAFEVGIKPARPVCKLNTMMRRNLTEWQRTYVDGKTTKKKSQ